jgi:hypothetical protein
MTDETSKGLQGLMLFFIVYSKTFSATRIIAPNKSMIGLL